MVSWCSFNGWGVTIHDSLDTMLLMNLTETFERAAEQVERVDFWLTPVSVARRRCHPRCWMAGAIAVLHLTSNHIPVRALDTPYF
jgi:hypothetical protein